MRLARHAAVLLVLLPLAALAAEPRPRTADHEAAQFAPCVGPRRVTCVVDGNTFWYRGDKIRIADINAPEVGEPKCPREADLGGRATGRLVTLLNAGAFTLAPNEDGTGRDRDRYGRLLRTVMRGGDSVGGELVREGLAEPWMGRRGNWC
jgi:endonuclease YncB( thermonuclease family)